MTEQKPEIDFSDVESRRSKDSKRRLSAGRKFANAIGLPLLRSILWLLNRTYRIEKVVGSEIADGMIADAGTAYMPCYWHSQQLVLSELLQDWIRRGFKAGFIISASVDGDVPARLARSLGAEVIRGSAARTGALVLRDARAMMQRGVSIVTTPDGPRGPAFEFKSGVVLMARIAGARLVPVGYAASRAWVMRTWDRFMIPKPFARIVITIGAPIDPPRGASMEEIENARDEIQAAMDAVIQASRDAVVDAT
ncbi:MAG: lysophospholipid acyltransferase family protein [Gammaproteobacteria bacterium]|nr:lysophospholipid acyltransferase family protein [Gammaproteobacteria bacterium]